MLNAFRRFLIRHPHAFVTWCSLLTWFGHLSFFWRGPRMTMDKIERVKAVIKPGDVLGVAGPFFSSLVIPGVYDHSLVYTGHGMCNHAVSPSVCRIGLVELLAGEDRVQVRRPRYVERTDWKKAVRRSFVELHAPYNFLFAEPEEIAAAGGSEKFRYCHWFTQNCLRAAGIQVGRVGGYYLWSDIEKATELVVKV